MKKFSLPFLPYFLNILYKIKASLTYEYQEVTSANRFCRRLFGGVFIFIQETGRHSLNEVSIISSEILPFVRSNASSFCSTFRHEVEKPKS
jgi:hypothetical protein